MTLNLSEFLELLSGGSLKVSVILTPSEEVIALQERVRVLEVQISMYKERAVRAEHLYACVCIISFCLLDFCRDSGVSVPKSLFRT